MYIITLKANNKIIQIGKELDYLSNGYPRIIELDEAYPINLVNVNIVNSNDIPEDINEVVYYYDGTEFYEDEK